MKVTYRCRAKSGEFRCIEWQEECTCERVWESGNLLYLMRGGYVYRCIGKEDVLKVV